MKINWKLGPQRCRNPECEAEILALDMGREYPLAIRYKMLGAALAGGENGR